MPLPSGRPRSMSATSNLPWRMASRAAAAVLTWAASTMPASRAMAEQTDSRKASSSSTTRMRVGAVSRISGMAHLNKPGAAVNAWFHPWIGVFFRRCATGSTTWQPPSEMTPRRGRRCAACSPCSPWRRAGSTRPSPSRSGSRCTWRCAGAWRTGSSPAGRGRATCGARCSTRPARCCCTRPARPPSSASWRWATWRSTPSRSSTASRGCC